MPASVRSLGVQRVGRWTLGLFCLAALAWTMAVVLTGDLSLPLPGRPIRSRDPWRPFVAAVLAATAFVVVSGRAQLRHDLTLVALRLRPAVLAALLAGVLTAVGLATNSTTAGGSDAYAYIRQADSWRTGQLAVPLPMAAVAPWPNAVATFVPYGYRPAVDGPAMVPVTAPGLSLIMAAFATLAGHCAMFWTGPLSGGLLVWTTFLIGRQLGSAALGLGAAWLIATSPTVLMMFKSPMSDVPCAAFWAAATALQLRGASGAAAAAGVCAAVAIAIRPNLVPLAAVLGAWLVWRAMRTPPGARVTTRVAPVVAFGAGTLPGVLLVAWYNAALYGSPLASGYGDLSVLFSMAHVSTNVARYGGWLAETQTPLAVLGIAALVPTAVIWSAPASRGAAALLLGLLFVVWVSYLPYTPFEAWWFLRFLLPSWPAIAVGTTAVVLAVSARGGRWGRAAGVAVLVLLGGHGLRVARANDVFPANEGERRYVTIAELVERFTEPSAVIMTGLNAGSVHYYSGRTTLRFDLLEPEWLDRTIEWLRQHDRHPYILLEDWELPAFERRFGSGALDRLARDPVLAYQAYRVHGSILLFDPLRPRGPTERPAPIRDPQPRCKPAKAS